ncbi:MAG: DMT family transporter [Gammaproteobacteria bacterium]
MSSPALPLRALLMLAVISLVWGTVWPLLPIVLREVSVWTFRALTMLSSAVLLLVLARVRGLSIRIPRAHWPALVGSALCFLAVWNVAAAYSAILIPSGQTAVLGFTMPLWSALLSWLVLRQRPGGRQLAAIALGGLAVGLLMWPGLARYAEAPAGFALGLGAGLGWAVGTLILQQRPIPVSSLALTGWQLLIAGLPITVGAWVFGDHHWFLPPWPTTAAIVYIALVPMSLGNLFWFAIVRMLPASIAGLSAIMVPVVAMISGALIHGEPLGPLQLAAMTCCVGALGLVVIKRSS